MKTLLLTREDATPEAGTFLYNFGASAAFSQVDQIAISSIQIPYSWYNITAELLNNQLQYIFPTSGVSVTRSITIPDGNYSLDTLNSFLQDKMIDFGDYAVDANGDNVYFLQLTENKTAYAAQIDVFPVPTSAQATTLGYTQAPSGGYPVSATTPQIVILDNAFKTFSGFTPATYPAAPQGTTYSILSQTTPKTSHVNSILISCSIINNELAVPNNIIFAFTASNVAFGDVIAPPVSELIWNNVQTGVYDWMRIQLLNELYQPILLRDNNLTIQFVLKKK